MTTESSKNGALTRSRMNFSRYVGHDTRGVHPLPSSTAQPPPLFPPLLMGVREYHPWEIFGFKYA